VYEVSPETVTPHAPLLIPLLPQCDAQERMAVFQLYLLIVQKSPAVLESCVPQLCGFLQDSDTSNITMQILLKLAQHAPHLLVDHFEQVRLAAKTNPSTVTLCAQILTTSGIAARRQLSRHSTLCWNICRHRRCCSRRRPDCAPRIRCSSRTRCSPVCDRRMRH